MTEKTAADAGNALGRGSKIVFVNRYFHPDQSATSQLLTDLGAALAQSGLDVHVICSRQLYGDARARLAPLETHGGVVVHRAWTTRFGRGRLLGRAIDYATFYGSSMLMMLHLLRVGDIVVAKTDPPLIGILAMAAAKLKRAHLINWLQDVFPEVASSLGANPLPPVLNALVRRFRNRSLRSARANVVLGERMRQRLLGMGIGPGCIHTIQNWAELRPAAPKRAEESALRSRLGFGDRFVVGYSGNLGRAHDYRTLLGAAAALRDERIVFLMIGSGAGMIQLARAVDSLELENFRFLPYQPREMLADCLAAADAHWLSLWPPLEGLVVPSKFYGILAAARPVIFIGDPDGELARDIHTFGCGAVIELGGTSGLIRLLTDWQADRDGCRRMGLKGYDLYCERYSAERAFAQWSDMLKCHFPVDGASPPRP